MFSIPQMVLVTLWFTFYNLLTSGTGLGLAAGGVVLNGLVVGAIMGDISTGFYLGGTYELMNIGLNPLGGSTVPNYNMGVVVGVAFGAVAGVETGMAVGIVVATLASTLDVLAKMVGSFFLHKAQDAVGKKNIKGNFQYVIIGFVLYAYLGIGALGAALVGVALAMIAYQNNVRIAEAQNMGGVGDE